MDVRASSTALDAVLFVLLVGAAIGVLSGIDAGGSDGRGGVAAETADVLSTSTAELTYTQSLALETRRFAASDTDRVTATYAARGTYAEHLANAVTAAPTIAGVSLGSGERGLEREVRNVTRFALPTRDANVHARVVWRPYADSTSGSEFEVGDRAPGDADVTAATATVSSGFPNVTAAARGGARSDGFDGVARAVADGVVEGLFPPTAVRTALYSEGPDFGVTLARYQYAARALDAEVADLLERRDVHATNEALAEALAGELREALSREFDTAEAAADAVRIHRVRIVVRAWSR